MRLSLHHHKRPVWKIIHLRRMQPFLAVFQPLNMQHTIHFHGLRLAGKQCLETVVGITAAIGAGSVAGGKCHRFIKEEQLGPGMGLRNRACAPTKIQQTSDPRLPRPLAVHHAPVVPHQYPAIASEGAACGMGDDLSRGKDAISACHTINSFVALNVTSG